MTHHDFTAEKYECCVTAKWKHQFSWFVHMKTNTLTGLD